MKPISAWPHFSSVFHLLLLLRLVARGCRFVAQICALVAARAVTGTKKSFALHLDFFSLSLGFFYSAVLLLFTIHFEEFENNLATWNRLLPWHNNVAIAIIISIIIIIMMLSASLWHICTRQTNKYTHTHIYSIVHIWMSLDSTAPQLIYMWRALESAAAQIIRSFTLPTSRAVMIIS